MEQLYTRLEMYDYGKTPKQKFSGVKFQIFPTDCDTWVFPVFVLEAPLQGGMTEILKW